MWRHDKSRRTFGVRAVVAALAMLGASSLGLMSSAASRSTEPGSMTYAGETSRASRLLAPRVLRAGPDAAVGLATAPEFRSPRPRADGEDRFVVRWGVGFETNAAARSAFDAALDSWAAEVSSTVPMVVEVSMAPLPAGVLAEARPVRAWRDVPGVHRDTWVVDALADALAGRDLCAELCPGEADIVVTFSNAADLWFFDETQVVPPGRYDFTTTALHEVAHGLGFLSSLTVAGGTGSLSEPPWLFDRFLQDEAGQPLTDTAMSPAGLSRAATSGLFFDGPATRAHNDGKRAVLEARAVWQVGSSGDHLAENVYLAGSDGALMTPVLGGREVIRDPGGLVVAMLVDLGWERAEADPTPPPNVLMVGDAQVREGRRGPRAAVVKASLTTLSSRPLTLTYRTVAGTANIGVDFAPRETTAVIPAGATSVNLVALVYGDQFREGDETFQLEVTAFSGFLVGDGVGVVTIVDDD